VSREPPIEITLGVAIPKGERQRWLVEKVVELGVRRLVPLSTERSVAAPTESALARLRRAVIEASKQCGRNYLMEITPGQELAEFVRAPSGDLRWIAHPGGEPLSAIIRRTIFVECATGSASAFPRCHLAIGPEGGFAPDEIAAAQAAGWQLVELGPRILRVETACLHLVSIISMLRELQASSASGAPPPPS
jgi:16S rRNA (uracil1498-N3)-methyltransferase